MTLKHSPGPFAYNTWDGECIILDAEGNCIADLMQSRHIGDGHLFAAAPDMLRLLRAILKNHRAADYGGMIKSLGAAAQFVERLDGDTCPGT